MSKCLCSICEVISCEKKKNLKKIKQGKRNRNTGRYAEQKLKKLFEKWSINIEATISSGSLKYVTKKVNQKYMFSGDFYTTNLLNNKRIKIECKKRLYSVFKKYYEITAVNIIYINNLCYIINQNDFKALLDGKIKNHIMIEDKMNKGLHSFFNQDNADIVTLISPSENGRYLGFLFCVKENIYKKIVEERGNFNDSK